MKRTYANWRQITYLQTECPHCGNDMNIEEEFEMEDWMEEMEGSPLDDVEILCDECDKIFGLTNLYKE